MKKILLVMIVISILLPSTLAIANTSFKVYVDGMQLNAKVLNMNGYTLVPLRSIFEAMDAFVNWDENTKTILSIKDDNKVLLTIGSNTAKMNGKDVPLAIPAQIINGVTMVPLRFIGEAFGAKVNYDQSTRSIFIVTLAEVHFMITSEPYLDPQAGQYSSEFEIMNNIFEGLLRVGPNQKYQNAMAESYDVSPDGLTWTFKLRDAKWSDGSPVTANDFVYSLERAVSEELGFGYAFIVKDYVKETKAIDDKTLVISLKKPTPYFKSLLVLPIFYPIKQEFVTSKGESFGKDIDNLLFNGPFVITKWVPDQMIVLEKNKNYWDNQNVKLEKITLNLINDSTLALNLYQAGDLDRVILNGGDVNGYKDDPAYAGQFSSASDSSVFWMELNNQSEVLKNANIRKALSWGFDRQNYIHTVLRNGSLPAFGLVPPEMPGPEGKTFREANGDLVGYDIEKAKLFLKRGLSEMGLEELPPLTYLGYDSYLGHDSARFIKEMYRKIGIDISVVNLDFEAVKERRKNGKYDLFFSTGWGPDYLDPMTFLDLFITSGSFNYGKWSNITYDQHVAFSQHTNDFTARMDNLLEAERILIAEEAGIVPVYYRVRTVLMKSYVKGFVQHPFGADSSWKWISIEK